MIGKSVIFCSLGREHESNVSDIYIATCSGIRLSFFNSQSKRASRYFCPTTNTTSEMLFTPNINELSSGIIFFYKLKDDTDGN